MKGAWHTFDFEVFLIHPTVAVLEDSRDTISSRIVMGIHCLNGILEEWRQLVNSLELSGTESSGSNSISTASVKQGVMLHSD